MIDTHTELETLVASDGHTILFRKDKVIHFFQTHYEENHSRLTQEEKEEEFLMNDLYADLIMKLYKQPLQQFLTELGAEYKPFNEDILTAEEDYNQCLANGPSEHESLEHYQLKLERLRKHKEWVEQQ